MKRLLALVGRSALAGVIFAVTFCAGVALLLGGAVWWIQRSDAESNDRGAFVEAFVAGVDDTNATKVVRVEISGEIGPPAPSPVGDLLGGALGAGDAGGVDAFNAARDRIHLATDEQDVKGLFLVIDSPGGDLTDSDLLWHDVQLFRAAQPGRFVFVHALAQCCSGGYYVAAAADFIMVVPTGEVGSIGVISDYGYNVADLARRFGVSNVVVSTGVNKDALNPLKPIATTENLLHRQPLHHIPSLGMHHKHIYPCRPAPHRKSCLVGLPLHRQVSFTIRPIHIYSVHPALRLHRHFLPRRIRHHPHSIPISRSIYPCPLSSPGHTPAPVAITQRVTVSAHHPHIRYHTVSSMQRVYILPTIVITCYYSP